jgi:uncharacterized membrane protein
MKRTACMGLVLGSLFVARAGGASDVRYTLQDVGRVTHGPAQFADPTELNGAGQAVLGWNLFPNGSGWDFYDPVNGSTQLPAPFVPEHVRPHIALGPLGQVAGYFYGSQTMAAFYDPGSDTVTDLHTPLVQANPSLASFSSNAVGVNAREVVIGNLNYGYDQRAFIWDPASGFDVLLGDIGPYLGLPAANTLVNAISATGVVAGWREYQVPRTVVCGIGNPPPLCTISYAEQHVFFFDGAPHDLGTLGGRNAEADGVTDLGILWGVSDTIWQFNPTVDTAQPHLFIYFPVNGVLTDIGLFQDDPHTRPVAANAIGEVIGHGGNGGFIYRNNQMLDLGVLGCNYPETDPRDVNLPGQVVGLSGTPPLSRAFVWDGDHGMRDLTTLTDGTSGQWVVTGAHKINGNGVIAADAVNAQGDQRAVLLTPYAATLAHVDVSVTSALALAQDGTIAATTTIANARAAPLQNLTIQTAQLAFGKIKEPPLDFYPPPRPCFDPGDVSMYTQHYANPGMSGAAAVLTVSGTVSGRSFTASQRVRLP